MTLPRGPVPPAYDPARLAAEAAAAGWQYRRRKLEFTWAIIQLIVWVAILFSLQRFPGSRVAFARWARHQMVRQGAVFIKLGQMLSTRVDAFSPEVLRELSFLQDKVPSFPYVEARSIIETDLGGSLESLFATFDPLPLAAASLGQVHPATLRDGVDIVVKVLRPGLQERFAIDLTLMRRYATWISGHPRIILFFGGNPTTPWVGLVDRLGVSLYQQLDLWTEGLHGEKFARNFANHPRVGAPAIYWTHSSTRVLAQERIYGYRFDDELAIRAAGIDYVEMAEIGIRAFTKQIFEDAFFHADTHPGNIFVTDAGKLVYLDFGMVEYIDESFQAVLVEMFIHVIQQDWPAFLEDMVRADIVPTEVPREELLPIFTDVWAAQLGFTDRRYTLQDVSDRFYHIMKRYPFRLPERFLFLTRTAASMEGVVYRADPSFKFLPIALPFFAKLVLERIDVADPWIISDLLSASERGGAFERLAGLLRMAIAGEPEQMGKLAISLVEVVAHPKAAPLRQELKERLLSGGAESLVKLLPSDFRPGPEVAARLQEFLLSPTGRAWSLELLEDARFPAIATKLAGTLGAPPRHAGATGQEVGLKLDLAIDWSRLFYSWFPNGPERRRAYQIFQALLADPDFPWAAMVDPMQQLQQLDMTRSVARARHLPTLLDFLGHRGTLPLLARGVLKGWSQNLGLAPMTGPLRGEGEAEAPPEG